MNSKQRASLIVARGYNGEIGINNKLLWNLPRDMKYFVNKTKGKNVVMGRKTYESLPGSMIALPGRANFVISRNAKEVATEYGHRVSVNIANLNKTKWQNSTPLFVENSIEDAILKSKDKNLNPGFWDKETIIIGGAQVYKHAIENYLVDTIYLTEIHGVFEGADSFFEPVDLSSIGFEIKKMKSFAPDDENSFGMSFSTWKLFEK